MTRPVQYTRRLLLPLTEDDHDALRQQAQRERGTVTAIVRRAVRREIEQTNSARQTEWEGR